MTEQLREQLKILINTFAEHRNDIDTYVDKIIELFNNNDQYGGRRRSSSIFDGGSTPPLACQLQRRRSSTYNEKGLVNNPDTMLYQNHDVD